MNHNFTLPRRLRLAIPALAPLIALIALLWCASALRAATIPVTGGCTLPDAITSANTDSAIGSCPHGDAGGDLLVLDAGALYELSVVDNTFDASGNNGLPPITSTITISGNNATIARTLAFACPGGGDPDFRLFYVDATGNLTLHDVTLRNGCGVTGGALFNEGTVVMQTSRVISNTATLGGGLVNHDGALTLVNSAVLSNTADNSGGGLYNESDSTDAPVTVAEGSRFAANRAVDDGGGLYNERGLLVIENSRVYSNAAGINGGGLYNFGGRATIEESVVYSNTVTRTGGGLINDSGLMTVRASEVLSNSASVGGGIANLNPNAVMTVTEGSRLAANRAGSDGGGLNNREGSVTIQDSFVYSNSAFTGGGISGESGTVLVLNSEVYSNTAENGGGISIRNFSPVLAAEGAHSPLVVGSGVITLENSYVYSNTAEYGGGLHNFDATATVHLSRVYSNVATSDGGGLYNEEGVLALSESNVYFNSAATGGGVANVDASAVMTVTGSSRISYNRASGEGGGLHNFLGLVVMDEALLLENSAVVGGGILNRNGAMSLSVTGVISNSAESAGGIGNVAPGAVMTLTQFSLVRANIAGENGGGIGNLNGKMFVEQTEIELNQAGELGGGVFLTGTSSVVTVTESLYLDNEAGSDGGAHFQRAGSSAITLSCIVGNSDQAVVYGGGASPIPAKENWWGAADGPSGAGPGSGDSVSGSVDFDDFLSVGPFDDCRTLQSNVVLEKTGTPTGSLLPGEPITYTLHFRNDGDLVAPNVVLTDTLPLQVQLTGITANVTLTQTGSSPLVWEAGDLLPGDSGTITLTAIVSPLLTADATITNTAVLTSDGESDYADNTDAVTNTVQLPRVRFASAAYSVAEDDGPAAITVTLAISNPYAAVAVDYASGGGSATADDDYTLVSATLTIPAGQTDGVFEVSIDGDTDIEPDETVNLALSNAVGAVLGSPTAAVLTLLDDDTLNAPPLYLPFISTTP